MHAIGMHYLPYTSYEGDAVKEIDQDYPLADHMFTRRDEYSP